MLSSSSSLQKCTKHTSINHTLAVWCQHLWNKHCKTAPCQCISESNKQDTWFLAEIFLHITSANIDWYYWSGQTLNNFENRSIFGDVMGKSMVYCFLTHSSKFRIIRLILNLSQQYTQWVQKKQYTILLSCLFDSQSRNILTKSNKMTKTSPSLSPSLCFSLLITRALINQPFSWESSAKPNLTGDQSAHTVYDHSHPRRTTQPDALSPHFNGNLSR